MLTTELNTQLQRIGDEYRRDGVTCIRNALDSTELALAKHAFEWSLSHPTPSACTFYDTEKTEFYQDLCNPKGASAYREVIENSPLADIASHLWQSNDVWFLYEQVFVKQGQATRRTPWHQDTPYLALEGEELAVMWISFDAVDAEHALEFVRGSHHGTLFDGSAFDPDDDTVPIYDHGLPRLPDIESNRDAWDIVSYAVEPGDVVVFHPSTLHGGAPTETGIRRRTLSLRFFGSDAVYAQRPTQAPAPLVAGLHDTLKPGDPFRYIAFPRLRPQPSGFEQIPNSETPDYTLKNKIRGS
jgi:ectoine hydroxylase-related dioxygenase (phytanoyl-CoA dioxygenase family)